MHRRSSALLLAVLVCGMACAQSAPILRVTPESLEPWPQVGFDLRVLDGTGAPVENVQPEQVTVREAGTAVNGVSLRYAAAEPQSVCLVLDRSGSTYDERNFIRSLMKALIASVPAQDELCLVTFSSQPHLDARLTMVHEQVTAALDFSQPNGGSALLDALELTVAEMQSHARFRSQAIILITDGGENASTAKYGEVERYFAETGAPVLFCLQTNDALANRDEQADADRMLRLSEEAGGLVFMPKSKNRLDVIQTLMQVLTKRYRLVYTAPSADADGRKRKLEIRLSKDLSRKKMSVAGPRGYYAPVR